MELFIVLFFVGASLGSFLNVAALRFLAGESFLFSRSRCPRCGVQLCWFELIPIVSFLLLRGHCKKCRQPIGARYLLVEAGMGTFAAVLGWSIWNESLATPFSSIALSLGTWAPLFLFLLYVSAGTAAFFVFLVDLDSQTIPVVVTRALFFLGAGLLALEAIAAGSLYPPFWSILAALGAGAFFTAIWALTRGRGMGLGDAELALALAPFLPLSSLVIFPLASFWLGALWGLGLMVFGGYRLKSKIPFGPFLVAGFYITLFLGETAMAYLFPFR